MKKFKMFLSILSISFFVFIAFGSMDDGTCDKSGCDNQATGWTNGSECAQYSYSVCRLTSSGGYCSKNHAIADR